jgi:hypothetical protein
MTPAPTGAPNDDLSGNRGQDVVAKFDSFTLDFVKMTFSLGPLEGELFAFFDSVGHRSSADIRSVHLRSL